LKELAKPAGVPAVFARASSGAGKEPAARARSGRNSVALHFLARIDDGDQTSFQVGDHHQAAGETSKTLERGLDRCGKVQNGASGFLGLGHEFKARRGEGVDATSHWRRDFALGAREFGESHDGLSGVICMASRS